MMKIILAPDSFKGSVTAAEACEAIARGMLPRGDVAGLVGVSARHGRRIVASLTERGVLVADSSRAPLRLAFPATLAPRWTPGLFPDRER